MAESILEPDLPIVDPHHHLFPGGPLPVLNLVKFG